MLGVLASLIFYVVIVGALGVVTFISTKTGVFKKSRVGLIGAIILWVSLIFNIIYTGLMGWHFVAASDLESLLDSITFFFNTIGFFMFYLGLKTIK